MQTFLQMYLNSFHSLSTTNLYAFSRYKEKEKLGERKKREMKNKTVWVTREKKVHTKLAAPETQSTRATAHTAMASVLCPPSPDLAGGGSLLIVGISRLIYICREGEHP